MPAIGGGDDRWVIDRWSLKLCSSQYKNEPSADILFPVRPLTPLPTHLFIYLANSFINYQPARKCPFALHFTIHPAGFVCARSQITHSSAIFQEKLFLILAHYAFHATLDFHSTSRASFISREERSRSCSCPRLFDAMQIRVY